MVFTPGDRFLQDKQVMFGLRPLFGHQKNGLQNHHTLRLENVGRFHGSGHSSSWPTRAPLRARLGRPTVAWMLCRSNM